MGFREILSSFRLVLEGTPGKRDSFYSLILELSEAVLGKNFALTDAEGNTSSAVE